MALMERRMSLTTSLVEQVARKTRDRGQQYFASRAVTIHEGDAQTVDATVEGTREYEVCLTREGREITASCTCPYFSDRLEICKHIWATLLAAESRGHLQGRDGKPPQFLTVDYDNAEIDYRYDEDDYDDDDEIIVPGPAFAHRLAQSNSPAASRRQPASNWRRALSGLRSSMEREAARPVSLSPGHEIIYVVDIEATLSRGEGLALDVATRHRKKDGEWSKPKSQRFGKREIAALPDPADRHALAILAGAREQASGYYYSYAYDDSLPSRNRLSAVLQDTLMPVLCATGRCMLRIKDGDALRPLHWDDEAAWEFWLKVDPVENGRRYAVSGELRRGEEQLSLTTPHMLVAGGLVFWEDRVARLRDFDAFPWIALLRQQAEIIVPAKEKETLVAELLRLPRLPQLDLSEDLRFEEVRLAPRPNLKIKRPGKPAWGRIDQEWLHGELAFDYDGQTIPAQPPGQSVYEPAQRRLLIRDVAAEQAAAARLEQVGFHQRREYYGEKPRLELAPRNLPKAVRVLLDEGWRVEAEGKLYRPAGEIRVEVNSGIDWFEVHGSASFGDQEVPLPALLASLRRGELLVLLGDGTVGMVPEEWLKKYGLLADLGKTEKDHLRFGKTQVGLLDALLAEQPDVQVDEQFRKARDQLRRFEGIAPADAPAGFEGQLREYQQDGVGWLHFLRDFGFGGCLADDMGLGKTVQVLALLESRRELRANKRKKRGRPAPSLVVVPRSVVFNWKQEAARFTPHLRVLDHTGVGRTKAAESFDEYDLILTTYGTLRRDIAELKDYRFDYAILDEAQAIKNANSQSAKAARLLSADHRLAMSGTPVENHLGELWSLFEFLNPGMLGTEGVLRMAEGGLRNPSEESRVLLAKGLRPFLLRRTKKQVAKDLPEKTEQTLYCDLEPPQRKLYDELRAHYRQSLLARVEREGIKKAKIQILEALLRLRQAACHPALIDKKADGPSAKLDTLMPQLQEVFEEGHKTLVFSQFTSLLAIVKKRLDEENIPYEYLDGRTRDRAARVERFQNDPNCKLFLISLKAGGLGLNLTAADYGFAYKFLIRLYSPSLMRRIRRSPSPFPRASR